MAKTGNLIFFKSFTYVLAEMWFNKSVRFIRKLGLEEGYLTQILLLILVLNTGSCAVENKRTEGAMWDKSLFHVWWKTCEYKRRDQYIVERWGLCLVWSLGLARKLSFRTPSDTVSYYRILPCFKLFLFLLYTKKLPFTKTITITC